MKAHRIMSKSHVWLPLFASLPAQALRSRGNHMIPGVIVGRDGEISHAQRRGCRYQR